MTWRTDKPRHHGRYLALVGRDCAGSTNVKPEMVRWDGSWSFRIGGMTTRVLAWIALPRGMFRRKNVYLSHPLDHEYEDPEPEELPSLTIPTRVAPAITTKRRRTKHAGR
jgi:hypothetical protein